MQPDNCMVGIKEALILHHLAVTWALAPFDIALRFPAEQKREIGEEK